MKIKLYVHLNDLIKFKNDKLNELEVKTTDEKIGYVKVEFDLNYFNLEYIDDYEAILTKIPLSVYTL